MAKRHADDDVNDRLVIARVGWCDKYDGDPNDLPRNGGAYNKKKTGHEHRNFHPRNGGTYYGYAQTTHGGKANLKRIAGASPPDADTDKEHVEDVCVAMIARSDNLGQVLVGWHRHATFYARYQFRNGNDLLWTAPVVGSRLLPVTARTLQIPFGRGATGESNLTYVRDSGGVLFTDRAFIDDIRTTILTYSANGDASPLENLDAVVRGQGFQYDALYRGLIEARAMAVARRALEKTYKNVDDRSKTESYDFLCRTGNGHARKIEVKGTTTEGGAVLVSANEYELAKRERVDLYVVSGVQLKFEDDDVSAHGGRLAIYVDWGRNGFSVKPRGYAVTLID